MNEARHADPYDPIFRTPNCWKGPRCLATILNARFRNLPLATSDCVLWCLVALASVALGLAVARTSP